MPGSPPSSTSDPGTTPPPRTRSSSPMPVCRRSSASPSTSTSFTGRAEPPEAPHAGRRSSAGAASSTSVFQPLQSGQRPSHLAAWNPQDWQVKCVRGLAMSVPPECPLLLTEGPASDREQSASHLAPPPECPRAPQPFERGRSLASRFLPSAPVPTLSPGGRDGRRAGDGRDAGQGDGDPLDRGQ